MSKEDRLEYRVNILLADAEIQRGHLDRAREILWSIPEKWRQWEWGYLLNKAHPHRLTIEAPDLDCEAVFSPDGSKILCAGLGDVRVWDATSGEELIQCQHDHARTYGSRAILSKDGRLMVTVADGVVHLWDLDSVKERPSILARHDDTWPPRLSREGHRLVIIFENTAMAWDILAEGGMNSTPVVRTDHRVCKIVLSPDGQQVLLVSGEKAKFWDIESGREHLFEGEEDRRWEDWIRFSPEGERILVEGETIVEFWDVRSAARLFRCPKPFAVSADGRKLAAVTGNLIKISDTTDGSAVSKFEGTVGKVDQVKFSPDGRKLLTSTNDGKAAVCDIDSGEPIARFNLISNEGMFDFSQDGSRVIGSTSSFITENHNTVWDAESGESIFSFNGKGRFSPDGRRVITYTEGGNAKVWEIESGEEVLTIRGHKGLYFAEFNPDSTRIVTSSDHKFMVWEIGEKPFHVPHGETVLTGNRTHNLIVTDSGNKATVWNSRSGRRIATLTHESDSVSGGSLSPEGNRVITIDEDDARVWDLESGEEVLTLRGLPNEFIYAEFSPDGRRILTSGCNTNSLGRIWDAYSGNEIMSFRKETFTSPTFSHDGQLILLCKGEGARLFSAETGTEVLVL